MKFKNIILLGGAGNIGKKLILNFSNTNKIFLIDKNKPNKIKLKNLNYIKYDFLKLRPFKKIPKAIDKAIFLIGKTGGPESLEIKNLKDYIDINCETLINFLKVSKKMKIKKIIYVSTEHVYGDNAKNTDKTMLIEPNPKNYYGVSKLLSEKILYSFYKKNNVSIDILRVPRVIDYEIKNLISTMIESTNKKKKITINNTKAKYNFIHTEDLIAAFEACLKQDNTGFRILNIFNNSKPLSLYDIAKYIKKLINNNLKIVILKTKSNIEHNPKGLIVTNKLSKKLLKWKPKWSNKKIINKMIKEYEFKKFFKQS